ncbi:MAG: hypothetical protein H5T62_15125 [Anaerolineae bacterium]|nr:hypothetical protein [Anaerolineae bacterium]
MEKKRSIGHYTATMATIAVILMTAVFLLTGCGRTGEVQPVPDETPAVQNIGVPAKKFKVLHIMSYHADWAWNQDQFNGFKEALEGLDVEYRVFEMDTKRQTSPEWIEKVSQEARDLIDTWQPDLVYTNDDNAQAYVAKYYVNAEIPFVFSGVNAAPETYGFVGSANVTGVLEQEHFVETVRLLKEIVPEVKKIAVVVDDSPMWDPVLARMREKQSQLPDVEFVSWDVILTFEEFKQKMTEYQTTVDAVGLIGIFNFKDENGENVPYQDVLRWTAENSNLPDFSFWGDRIKYGTLCTVTVSGYEQGLAAGKIARGILVEGRSPASYPMEPTVRGEPIVSLARANKLGIKIKSDILLTAKVVEKFEWEQ